MTIRGLIQVLHGRSSGFPTFFNSTLGFAIWSSWTEPQSAPCLVFTDWTELLPKKAMATHSSTLAWRIPGKEEPGGLLSIGLHRIRNDWSNLAATLVIVMDRVVSCVVGSGCLLWPVHSLGKTLLSFALLNSVLQGQICITPGAFLRPTFAFQSPIMKRTSFLGVNSRRSCKSS